MSAVQNNIVKTDSKVSLALNCWSHNHLSFLAITAYYINNNWNYNEILLRFKHVNGPHTEATLTHLVLNVLETFKIKDRLFAITTDNAANNNTMHMHLKSVLSSEHRIL